jgi:hypothetical protein
MAQRLRINAVDCEGAARVDFLEGILGRMNLLPDDAAMVDELRVTHKATCQVLRRGKCTCEPRAWISFIDGRQIELFPA